MKCNNCGFENQPNASFCGNCGNKLIIPVEQPQTVTPKKKNNKVLFVILGVILGIILIVIAISTIIKKFNKFIDPFENIDNLITNNDIKKAEDSIESIEELLEKDYQNGTINADKYLIETAYSIFEPNKLSSKYKKAENIYNEPSHLFEKLDNMYDKLSDDTLLYIFKKYALSDVTLDIEEDSNTIRTTNNIKDYKVTKLVDKDNNVSKLDNVILSSKGHFLIYYTKEGTNATTDESAKKMADFLELLIDENKKIYNLDFKYEPKSVIENTPYTCNPLSIEGKACRLLKKNNIDTKYIKTAMPIYMMNTNAKDTGLLGYYIPPLTRIEEIFIKVSSLFEEQGETIDSMTTTYAFPYFIVNTDLADFDDIKVVAAHELFHHYQKYICGNGKLARCTSGDFTEETTANFAASQLLKMNRNDTVLNRHSASYISDLELSIDENNEGYGAFIFGYYYSSIVNNGSNNLLNSMKEDKPLEYLYQNSNGKYKEIFLALAKKNLTQEHSNKLLISYKDGNIIYPKNHKIIENKNIKKEETINYSSMHYYYLNPNDYNENTQLIFNSGINDLTLQLFIQEDNKYKYLYEHPLNTEFVININEFNSYNELVFAIVDTNIYNNHNYTYEINDNELKTPTVTPESLNLKVSQENNSNSFICHNIEEDEDYRTVTQIKLSFDKEDKINDMYVKATFKLKNYDPNDPTFGFIQKVVTGLLYVLEQTYKEEFKYYKVITEHGTDKYSVTFKVIKNYYEALKNGLEIDATSKNDIKNSLQKEGYTCNYQK